MPEQITAHQLPVNKIFADDYILMIPPYQRPYSWTINQVEDLIDDLLYAIDDATSYNANMTPYFLGSVVLIKSSDEDTKYDVVDGQQRLTTLTILLSVLRQLEPEKKDGITKLIYQKADGVSVMENEFRLTLRNRDMDFFRNYIQNEVDTANGLGIAELDSQNIHELNDSQNLLLHNTKYALKRLGDLSTEQRNLLISYIASKCLLVVITAQDRESAYRIFSVLNNRGLDLSHTDIIKADVLGAIDDENEQIRYNNKWDDLEESVGREVFQDVFSYIRMIYRKQKQRGTIINELYQYVKPDPKQQPKDFIDKVLKPYLEALQTIREQDYTHENYHKEINNYFAMLTDHENSDWIPVAIYYLAHRRSQEENLKQFFKYLERLASYLLIQRANINDRITRYGELLQLMTQIVESELADSKTTLTDNLLYEEKSPLMLRDIEKRDLLDTLDGNIYQHKAGRYIVLRLSSYIEEEQKYKGTDGATMEHVLPQTPDKGSKWLTWFPDDNERHQWTHRIANLVPLSGRANSRARNRELQKKIDTYFKRRNDITTYALTVQVIKDVDDDKEWTLDTLKTRQERSIEMFKEMWELD
jgi:uncharacterized protein with ParB-like and HNH nuclease domain